MKLPKDNHNLTEMFKKARTPEVSEFNGEYVVDMLTVLPSFRRFSHRKLFYSANGDIMGQNLILNKAWGYFSLEKGVCDAIDSLAVVVINYNRIENLFLTRGVRDHVRCIERERLFLGRFHYLFMGRLYFLGYFSLTQ
jgi:hypothetical protein